MTTKLKRDEKMRFLPRVRMKRRMYWPSSYWQVSTLIETFEFEVSEVSKKLYRKPRRRFAARFA